MGEEASRTSLAEGLIQVYTGDGKGKTTAALGLTLRASGHGLRSFIVFFMKGRFPYGEQTALSRCPLIEFACFGQLEFVDPRQVKPEEREEASKALQCAREAMLSGKYDLIVLDEVNVAAGWKLISAEDVLKLLKEKPKGIELILTGRHAPAEFIKAADLVTEMVKVKHPYDRGIESRKGIEC